MDWTSILATVFEFILLPLIIAGVGYLIVLIDAKKKEVMAKTDNELHKKYVEGLANTISDCVLATKQTYVDTLKAQGKFDEEAQKEAFKRTYEAVMATLTDDAKKYLNEVINDLNTYITSKIESGVAVTKTVTSN